MWETALALIMVGILFIFYSIARMIHKDLKKYILLYCLFVCWILVNFGLVLVNDYSTLLANMNTYYSAFTYFTILFLALIIIYTLAGLLTKLAGVVKSYRN